MTTVGLATRRCSKCSEERPIEDFPLRADRPGHRRSQCRTCINARTRAYTRRRYSEDPEFAAARRAEAKRYRESQKGRERRRRYYSKNREAILENHRRWLDDGNRDRVRELAKAWRLRNADRIREYEVKYDRRLPYDVPIDRDAIHSRDQGKCWLCGEDAGESFHLDHVVPRSLGGPNSPENLRVACPDCNFTRRKKALHVTFHGPDA